MMLAKPSQNRWYKRFLADPRAEELGEALVHHAAELVSLAGADRAARETLIDAVIDSLVAQQQGSTRIPASSQLCELVESGNVAPLIARSEDAFRPLILIDGSDGAWLYHQRTLFYEKSLAGWLRERLDLELPSQSTLDEAVAAVLANPTRLPDGGAVELSDEQLQAVRTSSTLPMTVVTGGPGTGKTSIVVSLMRVLVRLGVEPDRIALAAPTGKAANRLGESIESQLRTLETPDDCDTALADHGAEPMTLHRLLRYAGAEGRFRRDETDPIAADWVIVDEASMIDLVLMERLVRCVSPQARLVLLGDVEQLPSVETGTVLRDLIPRGERDAPHVVRLRKSFRMDPRDPAGHAILRLAGAVRDGLSDDVERVLSEVSQGPTFDVVDTKTYRPYLIDFVDGWFENRIASLEDFTRLCGQAYVLDDGEFTEEGLEDVRRLFRHFERFRILCLTRVFATGADALNAAFHLRMARRSGVEGIPDHLPGEPVMMLRNDYDRGLFNGDQGLLLRVDTGDDVRIAAVFGDGEHYRAHHLSGLAGQIAHAWAMTVHKSQGSEFDDVALVLPEEDLPLLSRELLYTGLTRARRSVRIIGPRELFLTGVERAVQRWSGLAERIFAPH